MSVIFSSFCFHCSYGNPSLKLVDFTLFIFRTFLHLYLFLFSDLVVSSQSFSIGNSIFYFLSCFGLQLAICSQILKNLSDQNLSANDRHPGILSASLVDSQGIRLVWQKQMQEYNQSFLISVRFTRLSSLILQNHHQTNLLFLSSNGKILFRQLIGLSSGNLPGLVGLMGFSEIAIITLW